MEVREIIRDTFNSVFVDAHNKAFEGSLSPETLLLDTGLDSLGFAILIVRLEESLGFDPFVLSSEPYYPQTFGELVAFYESNMPK